MGTMETDRRGLIGAGALIAGAGLVAAPAMAQGDAASVASAAKEPQDAWLDRPGVRHRLAFDTSSAEAAEGAIGYAGNFYFANKIGYDLEPDVLAVAIILRHMSTPFGYNDTIWRDYGRGFAKVMKLKGDMAKRARTSNPLLVATGPEMAGQPNPSLGWLAKQGARFPVCGLATTAISHMMSKDAGKPASDIEAELKANLIPGALIVAAGIVAVNRVQEHGYAFAVA